MKAVVGKTPRSVTTAYRPDHDESGNYIFHTKIFNDAQLERNKRIRLEDLLTKSSRIPLHDGEKVDYAFSIPQEEWGFFCRDYPEIAKGIRDGDEQTRYNSALQLQILHPEWVIMAGNR